MEETRNECRELLFVLDFLKDKMKESKTPEVYKVSVKKLRRELLGLYQQILNGRKPVEKLIDTPKEIYNESAGKPAGVSSEAIGKTRNP